MYQVCNQHQNRIQRICLNLQCENRALCLLCDHPHGVAFRSIMSKQSQSYKKFQAIINTAIDKYFLQKQQSIEQKIRQQQIKLTKDYFSQLKIQIQRFLVQIQEQVLEKLNASQQQNFILIKKARINKNYVQVPPNIFKILYQVYQGMQIADIFQNNQKANTEQAFNSLSEFHTNVSHLMQARHYRMKVKVPDIRNINIQRKSSKPTDIWTNYDAEEVKKKFQVKLIKQSSCEFQSIISDCIAVDKLLFTTSYDKKLRIFDRRLNVKSQYQYPNILNKIHCIGEDTYSIAHSKEILIESIKQQKQTFKTENIMKLKGHNERINDLHSLNTRILGSSSAEGVKIWDLYKQKCQFTLKEQANPTAIRFLPSSNALVVGYNNHLIKIYSIQTMKIIKKYQIDGVPLLIDQGKCIENNFYVGSFKSNLSIFDIRMARVANQYSLKTDAVTCVTDSIYDQQAVAVGDRGGYASIVDLRTKKIRISWLAHNPKTHLSKPRGVVNIIQDNQGEWITVGCNDKSLKEWQITNLQ